MTTKVGMKSWRDRWARLRDGFTAVAVLGSWGLDGPRLWPADAEALRILSSWRREHASQPVTPPQIATDCSCCPPVIACCAG